MSYCRSKSSYQLIGNIQEYIQLCDEDVVRKSRCRKLQNPFSLTNLKDKSKPVGGGDGIGEPINYEIHETDPQCNIHRLYLDSESNKMQKDYDMATKKLTTQEVCDI